MARAGATERAERPEILIGLLLPPEESEPASLRQGALLAVKDANQLSGPRAGLVVRGRLGQWGADGEEAGRMVLEEEVQGLIAPPGGIPSHLALQVAGRTATPVVTLCPDASVTGAGIPWMVRIVPQDTDEAQALFRGFHNKTNQPPWRWLPVIPGDRAGRESKRDLTLAARQVGAQLEAPLEVLPATTNFAELARRALALKPEGIVLWLAPAQAGRLARALRSGGYAGVLAGPARLGGKEFATEAGVALEGFITTGTVQDQEGEALRERFQAAYRGAFWVDADWTAMAAYDAARLLVEVIRKVGEGPLHRAFPPDKPMAGVSGRLQFDQYGRRVSELCLMEWRQGRLQVLVSQGRQDRRSSL